MLLQVIGDLFQIFILSVFFYLILRLLRGTPGMLMLGVVLIAIPLMNLLAYILELNVLEWMLSRLLAVLPLFLLIIFQSEIRRLLTFIGRHQFGLFKRLASEKKKQTQLAMIDELVDCVCSLNTHPGWLVKNAKNKQKKASENTGALIAIESAPRLSEYIERGVPVDAKVSSLLLQAIFYKGGPLHDGGVIIRNGMIAAAACQFPSSTDLDQSPVHTRHNAAIGLSLLVPDAVVIVVSEETGNVSITTEQGQLETMDGPRQFRNTLCKRLGIQETANRRNAAEPKTRGLQFWFKELEQLILPDIDPEKRNSSEKKS